MSKTVTSHHVKMTQPITMLPGVLSQRHRGLIYVLLSNYSTPKVYVTESKVYVTERLQFLPNKWLTSSQAGITNIHRWPSFVSPSSDERKHSAQPRRLPSLPISQMSPSKSPSNWRNLTG
jgi:hypothetical protein